MNSIKSKKLKTNVKDTVHNICTVLANIKKLKNSHSDNDNETTLLVLQTENILSNLEQSLSKITKLLQKRKLQRQKKRIKRLKLKRALHNRFPKIKHKTPENVVNEQLSEIKPKIKPHVQLKKQHDARQYLEKFNLIIKLFEARVKNSQATAFFAEQFDSLIAIWSNIAAQNNTQTIEQQWHEILYGAAQQQDLATTRQLSLKSFRRIRRTWNSYLTRNLKLASKVQVEPVLPPEQPNSLWISYCLQN